MKNIVESNMKELINYFNNNENIMTVYLFGSYAKGNYSEMSDIDIGIIYKKEEEFLTHCSRTIELQKILNNKKVDVVNLEKTTSIFRNEVIKTGKIIFERDNQITTNFIYRTMQEYIDIRPYYELTKNSFLS